MLGFIKRIFSRANKRYISETDLFLNEQRSKTTLSTSQRKEIDKHVRIAELRDHSQRTKTKEKLWKGF